MTKDAESKLGPSKSYLVPPGHLYIHVLVPALRCSGFIGFYVWATQIEHEGPLGEMRYGRALA